MKGIPLFLPPTLPTDTVPRERLQRAIRSASRSGKWVALCAPAGCGKTIAALQCITPSQGRCAWLSVTKSDNDPDVFYGRFYAAAAYARGTPSPIQPMTLQSALSALAGQTRARLKGWLVLDNLHLLDADILSVLPSLLTDLPGNVTTLLLSRTALPKSFDLNGQLGRMITLDAATLAFTKEEATALYALAERSSAAEDLEALLDYTGGWAIALVSGLLAPDTSEYRTFGNIGTNLAGKSLAEYIDENIWPFLDEATRYVLLCCAGADSLSPSLCALLTGRDDAGAIFSHFAVCRAFTTQTGPNNHRFHGLFRDYLLDKQRQQLSQSHLQRLSALLARWLEEHQSYYAALVEYVKRGDDEGIARCLDSVNRYSINQPVEIRMRFAYAHLIGKLPDELFNRVPHLLATRVFASFLAGDDRAFTHWLDVLNNQIPNAAAEHPALLETIGFINGLDFRAPISVAIARLAKVLAYPAPGTSDDAPRKAMQEGVDAKQSSIQPGDRTADTVRTSSISLNLPFFHRSMRDFSEFYQLRENDVALLRSSFGTLIGADYVLMEHCLTGGILYEQGELILAAQHAFCARALLDDTCGAETILMVQALTASVLSALGGRQQAYQVLEETPGMLLAANGEYLEINLKALVSRLRMEEGNLPIARDWLARYGASPSARLPFFQMTRHFATLSAYIALQNHSEARQFGKLLLDLCQRYRRPLDELETLVLLAANASKAKQEGEAKEYTWRALRIASAYRYTRLFNEWRETLRPLLRTMVEDKRPLGRKSGAFLRRLLKTWEGAKKPGLTPRQRRILLDMMDGYSYEAIAKRLGIARSSVKSQVIRMYRTLGVNHAKDAMLVAKTLGLLDAEKGDFT